MRRAWVVALGPVAATVASCLGPTEIRLNITTNACAALDRVDVYVGKPGASPSAPATSTGGCTGNGEVGTLTIVPSGGVDEVVELAVVGAVGGACASPSSNETQCIVARRSLSFVPHTHLDLPIFLDSACAGFPCPDGQTCVADPAPRCASATCDADGGVACNADGGSDAEADIAVLDVPVVDSPPSCPVILTGTPTYSWSFDGLTDAIHEDAERTTPEPFTNAKLANASPVFCGNYLSGGPQPIAANVAKFTSKTFTVAFAYRALGDGILLQMDSASQFGGYAIAISASALVVSFFSNLQYEVYRDGGKTSDGAWHTAIVDVAAVVDDAGTSSTTLRVTRDGVPGKLATTTVPYGGLGVSLSAGSLEIDQISYVIP